MTLMNPLNFSARRSRSRRRGITILLVLALISIALATSYALVRSQITAVQIENNSNRSQLAKQAAMAGLSAAMRKMHETAWAGVGTQLTGSLSATERYEATFTAGDTTLTVSNPDYGDLPYRVTIVSNGFSTDPSNTQLSSSASVGAVLRLVPRALGAAPSNWTAVRENTVYQLADTSFSLDVPCRIEGAVRIQSQVKLGSSLSWNSGARQRYLGDLNAMRSNGFSDYRPLSGSISMPLSKTDSTTKSLMTAQLGLTLTDISATSPPSMMLPTQLTTYRIYQGGPSYNVGSLPSNLEDVTITPNPATNPLGIYFRSSSGSIRNNANVTGTIIYNGDLSVQGTNLRLAPASLPNLFGSSDPVCLPATVVNQKCTVVLNSDASVEGVMLVGREFEIERGGYGTRFALTGRVVSQDFTIGRRNEWNFLGLIWDILYTDFTTQLSSTSASRTPYFPVYINRLGPNYAPNPRLTLKPTATPQLDHWQDLTAPIFVPHASDGGLRWEVLRCTQDQ